MGHNKRQTTGLIDFVAGGTLLAGAYHLQEELHGVIQTDVVAGETATLDTEGVYELTAKAADVAAVGVKAYWDPILDEVTITSTSNRFIGHFATAKAAGPVTADVLFRQVSA